MNPKHKNPMMRLIIRIRISFLSIVINNVCVKCLKIKKNHIIII
jgi:hypothetical protein